MLYVLELSLSSKELTIQQEILQLKGLYVFTTWLISSELVAVITSQMVHGITRICIIIYIVIVYSLHNDSGSPHP